MAAQSHDLFTYSQQILGHYRNVLDHETSPDERIQHEKMIDEFRSSNPHCMECAFILIQHDDLLGIYLGLSLIEYYVKYRWNSLSLTGQVQFKDQLLMCKNNVGSGGVVFPLNIKEGVAKVVVEVAKQMWPHNWTSFVPDICNVEEKLSHIELILLIFQRLAEDLLSFDSSLSSQRKSTMLSSLKEESSLIPIFNLILTALQGGSAEVAMTTLLAYVDWVDLKYLTFDNCRLVLVLITYLSSLNEVSSLGCECLMSIWKRKGSLKTSRDHRQLFLHVLSKDILDVISQCVDSASKLSESDEVQYMFMKKLCCAMTQLGLCQLLPLWETSSFTPPDNLHQFLSIMLNFLSHPSLVVSSTCLEFWVAVSHHEHFKSHEVFILLLPQLLKILRSKQYKVGDPALPIHISCRYSQIDFEGSDQFNILFSKSKGLINRILTDMVSLGSAYYLQEVTEIVNSLVVTDTRDADTPNVGGAKMSPVFLDWDAAISFIECWISGLNQNQTLLQGAVQVGVAILETLLTYNPPDVTRVFCHLKALEGNLQTFVAFKEELLQLYLEKILTFVVYPGVDVNKFTLTKDQKQSRHNSLYCLINLVKSYAKSLLPATNQLLDHYSKLVANDILYYSEKCMFIESFTILCHFQPSDVQDILMEKLLNEVKSLSYTFKSSVSSLPNFINHFYLNKDISDEAYQLQSSPGHLYRYQLCYCAHTIMTVLQQCSPRAKRICNVPESSTLASSLYRHIMPLLVDIVFPLIKVLQELWSKSSRPLLSQFFQGLHSLHQQDKESILGIHNSSADDQDELSKIHQQLIVTHDQSVMAVGFTWTCYGPDVLSNIGFIEAINSSVFEYLLDTNQMRIKPVIRSLIVPMVTTCPSHHWQISLAPILTKFCCIIFNILQQNWSVQLQSNESDEVLSDEVIIHQFTVNLTREYVKLLDAVCLKRDQSITEINEEMNDKANEQSNRSTNDVLSDLAIVLFKSEDFQNVLLMSVFIPLGWLDGSSVRKCIAIATAIFDKIPLIQFGERSIHQIMEQVFMGLRIHGEDNNICLSLIVLALQIYEGALPSFPSLSQLLSSLPESNQAKVKSFNQLLANCTNGKSSATSAGNNKTTKKKRDELRKLLLGVIGKPLGELYKRPSHMFMDLPLLAVKKEQRAGKVANTSLEENDLTLLFNNQ